MPDKLSQFKEHLTTEFKKFNGMLSYEELKSALQTLINFVKQQKELTAQELEAIKVMLKSFEAKLESDQTSEMADMKKEMMMMCEEGLNKVMLEKEAMMSEMDKKMSDMEKAMPDEVLIAHHASQEAITAIKPLIPDKVALDNNISQAGDLIVKTVNNLPAENSWRIEDIYKLREELDELRQLKGRVLGGGGFSLMALQQHILPWTETSVAPNGVLTDFVIGYTPNPTNSLEIMVDNSPLFETSDWTYATATKTVTFLIAPPSGSTIRYKCII